MFVNLVRSPSNRELCADQAQLKFRGVHGQGFLFHTAFNYKLGEPVERNMTTGLHTIRDMYCGRCNQYVGWRYDKAEHEAESYKIGKFLMEGEMLREVTGLISEIQAKL